MDAPLRFLIVDDDELIRTVLRIALRRVGHEVYEAAEPALALELASELQPDVVVCDFRLGWSSGETLLAQLEACASEEGRFVPAMILITGEERAAWPYPQLRKPFGAHELLHLVARLVEPRSRAVARGG